MDEETVRFSHEKDDDFRSALHWWLQLHESDTDSQTLREFGYWIEESASNWRSYVHVDALSQTVDLALSKYLLVDATAEANALLSAGAKGK